LTAAAATLLTQAPRPRSAPPSSIAAASSSAEPPGDEPRRDDEKEKKQEKRAAAVPPLLLSLGNLASFSPSSSLPPSLSAGRALLLSAASALSRSFWPILLVHSLASCATFLVHRISHRLTNAAALLLLPALKNSAAAAEAVSLNPWWLCPDPSVASFASGYQWLVLALFVAAFPLTVACRVWAAAATAFLCLEEEEEEVEAGGEERTEENNSSSSPPPSSSPSPPPSPSSSSSSSSNFKLPPLFPPFRKTLSSLRSASPRARGALPRAWAAELLVALRAVPLQALSLLVFPLPWTLPRLLDLQVAPVVAAVEGLGGKEAVERARGLTSAGSGVEGEGEGEEEEQAKSSDEKKKLLSFSSLPFLPSPSPRRAALAWPFLFLLLAPRALAALKEASLATVTPRMAAALPEIPLLLAAAGGVGGVVLARVGDVLPFVAWRWFVREEEKRAGR